MTWYFRTFFVNKHIALHPRKVSLLRNLRSCESVLLYFFADSQCLTGSSWGYPIQTRKFSCTSKLENSFLSLVLIFLWVSQFIFHVFGKSSPFRPPIMFFPSYCTCLHIVLYLKSTLQLNKSAEVFALPLTWLISKSYCWKISEKRFCVWNNLGLECTYVVGSWSLFSLNKSIQISLLEGNQKFQKFLITFVTIGFSLG